MTCCSDEGKELESNFLAFAAQTMSRTVNLGTVEGAKPGRPGTLLSCYLYPRHSFFYPKLLN